MNQNIQTLVKHISFDFKCKFDIATCNSSQKQNNNDKCQRECEKYHMCKKDCSWNTSMHICENSRYLKSIVDDSVSACDKIIKVTNSVSTNVTNTVPTNVTSIILTNFTSTVPVNFDYRRVRYKNKKY